MPKKEKTAPQSEGETQETATEPVEETKAADEAQKKYEELNDRYLRTLAEYDNYRKRTIKERESLYPDAKATVVATILPVLDNLKRAIDAEEECGAFYEGVVMVLKQLEEALTALGVEKIPSVGNPFDPMRHNAVMHVDDESKGENMVVEEFQTGYQIGDRVIRHSMVKVAN